MAASFDPIQVAFENAMSSFKAELKDDQVYNDILQITTIDQVYDATDEIQKQQAKEGHLRHLSKIAPYLERLNEYAATVEVFTQVKPEVLALIWGPIKLLLQWTSALRASFDAIINTMAEVGELLPEFKRVIALFDQNVAIKEVMVLFFRDMLDFYLVALKFFKSSRWKYLYESLWPKHKDKIKVVMTHIENHARLMRNEVRLEHIQQEHEARRRALANFEQEDRERRAQEFHRIKTDIAPQSYDDTLDAFKGLVYQGTGLWLQQDAVFKKWLSPTSSEPKILWLQGIPGAGKTYLASGVIQTAQQISHTAFAFVSYKNQNSITAMSVIHSLIFRLVSGNDDLQTVTCQSCSEESKRTLQGATDLLVSILACTGPTYLIVDGLDEMGEGERGRLLNQLMQVPKLCHEARLFISSRAEADLVSTLGSDASIIQIGKRNLQCIQTFVSVWAKSWIAERNFEPDERTEIELGLEPLASKSQGMFLYARVVLRYISELDTFGDIQEELRTLPESLHDAYGRILKRINSLDQISREKACRVLGWIGCSPIALTVQEIQQALTIDMKDIRNTGRVRGSLNLVRICGPIVEVVNDYVQFVHFTVKEYIFSHDISGSIDLQTATLDLALRCMTYLRREHHDTNLSDEEVKRNILLGAYALDWFAANMWSQLTKNCLSQKPAWDLQAQVASQLVALHSTRGQVEFLEDDSIDIKLFLDLDLFKDAFPDAHAILSQALRFRQTCTASEYCIHPGAPWIGFDPLTISASSARIQQKIDYLLAHDKVNGGLHQQTIRRWYGQRPSKCQYLSCPFNRTGFPDEAQRRVHTKSHDLPWKCGFTGCEYSPGGFLSKKMRDDHFDRAHSIPHETSMAKVEPDEDNEIPQLLIDLAKMGLVDSVRVLIPKMTNVLILTNGYGWIEAMFRAAISSGSSPMVKICTSHIPHYKRVGSSIIEAAVQSRNVEMIEHLLTCLPNDVSMLRSGIKQTILLNDHRLIDVWAAIVTEQYEKGRMAHALKQLIGMTANDRSREELFLRLWEIANEKDRPEWQVRSYHGDLLICVAKTTCSLVLAEYLLKSGASVDHQWVSRNLTALNCAAQRDTEESAKLMQFLLFHGADPDIKQLPRNYTLGKRKNIAAPDIRNEKGPLGISKWLGVTWDELVRQTQGFRQGAIGNSTIT